LQRRRGHLFADEPMRDCDVDRPSMTCPRCGFVARTRDTRRNCPAPLGVGDTIAKFARAIGFKRPCKRCKRRQEQLNNAFPYEA
jgi:hypothetical protein